MQKLVLRLYAKDETISFREIAEKVIRPNKTMIGKWAIWFEQQGYITRIGRGRSIHVFVTEKGRKAMR